MHFVYCEQFFRFFRHPIPPSPSHFSPFSPPLLYPFSDGICIALVLTSRQNLDFLAAISIAAMLTQLHLKNAPKFVSLFASNAAMLRCCQRKYVKNQEGKNGKDKDLPSIACSLHKKRDGRGKIATHMHFVVYCI